MWQVVCKYANCVANAKILVLPRQNKNTTEIYLSNMLFCAKD